MSRWPVRNSRTCCKTFQKWRLLPPRAMDWKRWISSKRSSPTWFSWTFRCPAWTAWGWSASYASEASRCRTSFSSRRLEEHTSELQSHLNLVCRLLLEKKKYYTNLYENLYSRYISYL